MAGWPPSSAIRGKRRARLSTLQIVVGVAVGAGLAAWTWNSVWVSVLPFAGTFIVFGLVGMAENALSRRDSSNQHD